MEPRRTRSAAALGTWLARRGVLAVTGLVVTGLVGVAAAVTALVSPPARVALLPELASSAIAWGGGVMLAFGASLRALAQDREQGVLALARARGVLPGEYARGRVVGLVVVLAVALGAATVVACLGAVVATRGGAAILRSSGAAVVYVLVFAATLGPVAMATLGARTRAGGYLTLVAVLVVPELLAGATEQWLPRGWGELTSLPAALAAVRAGVAHPVLLGAHAARALAALAAVVALSSLVVAARAYAPDAPAGGPWPERR